MGAFAVHGTFAGRALDARTSLPPSSTAGAALFAEVGKRLAAARSHPAQVVRLELVAPASALVGHRVSYTVRLTNAGTAPLGVAAPELGPWLETAILPAELPLWQPLGDKLGRVAPTNLAPGASLDLAVAVTHTGRGRVAVLARFAGRIEMTGVEHLEGAFFTRLTSQLATVEVRDP
jgi:hypothetical protein